MIRLIAHIPRKVLLTGTRVELLLLRTAFRRFLAGGAHEFEIPTETRILPEETGTPLSGICLLSSPVNRLYVDRDKLRIEGRESLFESLANNLPVERPAIGEEKEYHVPFDRSCWDHILDSPEIDLTLILSDL